MYRRTPSTHRKPGRRRGLIATAAVTACVSALLVGLPGRSEAAGSAPGAPGLSPTTWAPANKQGYGTSKTLDSKVWFTLQDGGLSEIYYPDLGTPSVRDFRYVVSDGSTFTDRDSDGANQKTELVDRHALIYKQTDTAKSGKWRLTKTYLTDPDRSTVVTNVTFESLTGGPLQLYALYNPRLSNSGAWSSDDTGRTSGSALLAQDSQMGTALVSSPAFTATSSGYLNASDGYTDLRNDHTFDWRYDATQNGNVVQTGQLPLTGLAGSQNATVALGFAGNGDAALTVANATLAAGFDAVSAKYAAGWHDYVATLKAPPASLKTDSERALYDSSVMILSAIEDKTNRGAFVASPTMPWAWGTNPGPENPSGAYHLVWARDVAGKAGGLMTAGDNAAAERALNYLFTKQQKNDGSFPQNSTLDGREHWTNTQMDEVADPIILAWSLNKKDADTSSHVKRAADYIVGNGPFTKEERWENQPGYSPATIAAEIAGLVCAADIAAANGDTASQQQYLAKADDWQAHVKGWTATNNGPYSSQPYFLRLSTDGNPNASNQYKIGDSGPNNVDQRSIVDPSFLELVRLGILPADDPAIRNTIPIVDAQLGENTPSGQLWHRYNYDGYGEQANGGEWNFGFPDGSQTTRGRLWPLFAGERGEYELANGQNADSRLQTMANTATEAGLLPEQVWDNEAPAGSNGFTAGRPSFSATPLGWAHGQFIRLAWSIDQNQVISRPTIVACRYQHICPGTTAPGAPGKPVASQITSSSVTLSWSAATAGSNPLAGYDVYQQGVSAPVASTNAATLSATVSGLQPNTAYTFTVKAKDNAGLTGPASAATSVTTASGPAVTPPGAPGKPAASQITSSSVTLSWSAATAGSNPLTGYDVYQQGVSAPVASTNAGTLSATVSGLQPNTAYTFTVKAKDSTGLTGPASAATSVATQAAPSTSAKVQYSVASDWGSGFVANVTITNTGSTTISPWSLGFTFAGNQRVTSGWSANWTQSGAAVTAANLPYNASIAPGESLTIGFNGSYSGTNQPPAQFTLNGAPTS